MKPTHIKRLIVLGSGFGAHSLLQKLSYRRYQVILVSPRNHFLFTPLLPSTAVGTIEFRSIVEPVRNLQPRVNYLQAACTKINPEYRGVSCLSTHGEQQFTIPYDLLVIATGVQSNTYGIPGVAEHACFLKELKDARTIRQRILDNFEKAALPGLSDDEKHNILHFVICGGGPTGIEFAAEVHDFVVHEVGRYFPELIPFTKITLIEAGPQILTVFDTHLREKAMHLFHRQNIQVMLGNPIKAVEKDSLKLSNNKKLKYGLLLWAAGNAPVPFVQTLPCEKDRSGRILTDDFLRVPGCANVYALGDCSVPRGQKLPQTAQVAMQQGKYLARCLNTPQRTKPFHFKSLGTLAYIGSDSALVETSTVRGSGFLAWLFWRSVYLTRIVRWRNKIKVVVDWALN
ncbi:MAG: FAD-dependent oxidoreductase, partial [FCB group bacterium]|nr:FAD-dependent oxidoreductase [FCB group bacterium]